VCHDPSRWQQRGGPLPWSCPARRLKPLLNPHHSSFASPARVRSYKRTWAAAQDCEPDAISITSWNEVRALTLQGAEQGPHGRAGPAADEQPRLTPSPRRPLPRALHTQWAEGTQIEPVKPWKDPDSGHVFQDYGGQPAERLYLSLTRAAVVPWRRALFRRRSGAPPPPAHVLV
jgi:hypothetical protein